MRPTSNSPPALRCQGLVKRYGDVTAVAGLDLAVRRGECFGRLGPNGADKTTTVEMFEGVRAADAGEVEVLGDRWTTGGRKLREAARLTIRHAQLGDQLCEVPPQRLHFRSLLVVLQST